MTTENKTAQRDPLLEVPIELVPLPSCGKVYSISSPLHGKEDLEIYEMTTSQENILTSPALAKKGTMLTELMRSCLVDKSIDPADMIVGDRYALLAAIRITGYGPQLPAKMVCSECDAETERTFNIAGFNLKRLTIEPVAPGQNLFSFLLPRSKRTVEFRFMTGRDEEDMHVAEQRQKKLGLTGALSTNITSALVRTVVSVDGISDPSRVANFVRCMNAGDSLALRSYMGEHQPGVEFKEEQTCPACGHVEEVDCPLDRSFLWPAKRSG